MVLCMTVEDAVAASPAGTHGTEPEQPGKCARIAETVW